MVFTGAVIIDGNGGMPIENGVLVVRAGKIEAVGPRGSVQIPPDAQVRDLGGKVVMPGLADMHIHFSHGWNGKTTDLLGYQRYLNALLYCGVTTILDTGNTIPLSSCRFGTKLRRDTCSDLASIAQHCWWTALIEPGLLSLTA